LVGNSRRNMQPQTVKVLTHNLQSVLAVLAAACWPTHCTAALCHGLQKLHNLCCRPGTPTFSAAPLTRACRCASAAPPRSSG
jgi:hypothetical protein